ncbi:MAG: hypothetical protein ACC646_12865 [Paracoccaceae bacterium]
MQVAGKYLTPHQAIIVIGGTSRLVDKLDSEAPGFLKPLWSPRHDHVTPSGSVQKFRSCLFRKF